VATRYHEFKTKPLLKKDEKLKDHLRDISTYAILERAKSILGQIVRPQSRHTVALDELPGDALSVELDLEETFDVSPLILAKKFPLEGRDLMMEYSLEKKHAVVLSVDTSLSMTGEKLALTAVALAVVLLQFPDDPIGIVAFENQARVLKRPDEKISLEKLIQRFLEVPAQGYTHLETGIKTALKLLQAVPHAGLSARPSTLLLTDGKYTAGRDPGYLGSFFDHLVVLKMGNERSSRGLCLELSKRGHGVMKEIEDLENLPQVMYGVVKDLLRGRSLSA
jgi:Mg-chelatase subunit ChlD